MHNGRVLLPSRPWSLPVFRRTAVPAACALLALTGCTSGGSEADSVASSGSAGQSASSSPTPQTDIEVPDGVKLTQPGAELSYGDSATVAVEPSQNAGSVLTMTVSEVRKAAISDFSAYVLDDRTKSSTPFYVDVSVTNEGPGKLGAVGVPLFAQVGDDTLVEASNFLTPFKKCPSVALPDNFGPGKEVDTCLVFLLPDKGELQGVAFAQSGTDPIVWSGALTTPSPSPKADGKKKQKNNN